MFAHAHEISSVLITLIMEQTVFTCGGGGSINHPRINQAYFSREIYYIARERAFFIPRCYVRRKREERHAVSPGA